MSHLVPHRLGALAAGRITGRAAGRMRVHLDGCDPCRAAWDRIRGARAGFGELAGASGPDLRWDRMRAQIYWSIGSGAHPVATARRRGWLLGPVMVAAAAAALVWLAPWRDPAPTGPLATAPAAAPDRAAVVAPIAVELVPAPVLALPTLVEGDVTVRPAGATTDLIDPAEIGASPLGTGARLTTANGRAALQLGVASTLTLAPRSSLVLRRFDVAGIELVVEGQIDIEVARRAEGQRFVVVAGGRTIEVRGTAFRVSHRDGQVAVACEHGRVAVTDGASTLELGAGQAVEVSDGDSLLGRAARPLSGAELSALLAARPPALPMWTDPVTVLRTTAPLSVVAPRLRAVRVDGVVVGAGPMWMRVPAGRHLVEAEHAPGRFGAGRWIEVGTAATSPLILTAEPPASPSVPGPRSSGAGRTVRRAELRRALDQGRIGTCVRALAKQGVIAGTHIEFEIGVDGDGALRFLNIADTDLPSRVADCVRDAVAATRLGPGPAASWRHRLSF